MRKQDFEGSKKWLDKIKNPESALTQKQNGYYNYLNGLMLSQTNMTQAEKYFKKAVQLGLSMDADLAMAKINLAGIAMTKNRRREADILLTEAKKLDKHNMLGEQIKMMKKQMKQAAKRISIIPLPIDLSINCQIANPIITTARTNFIFLLNIC